MDKKQKKLAMNAYIFEVFFNDDTKTSMARVHKGNFNENRDVLSPNMISTREFMDENDQEALNKGMRAARALGVQFDTFME